MKILITSIGNRVELIQHFKKEFYVVGIDSSENIAGRKFVDKFYLAPRVNEERYSKYILNICEKENIDLLIPLYEEEFLIMDSIRKELSNNGTTLLLSSKEVIDLTKDKLKMNKILEKYNISMPRVFTYEKAKEELEKGRELFIKPRDGMGSKNTFKINNLKELEFFNSYVRNNIIQEYIVGEEYTVDALLGEKGELIYIVPRIRVETRSGEVVKSQIILDKSLINISKQIIQSINENIGKLVGPITIQWFKSKGKIYLIEINPRFGGGVPLTLKAGAEYSKRIKMMIQGLLKVNKLNENIRSINMCRYYQAVYK